MRQRNQLLLDAAAQKEKKKKWRHVNLFGSSSGILLISKNLVFKVLTLENRQSENAQHSKALISLRPLWTIKLPNSSL